MTPHPLTLALRLDRGEPKPLVAFVGAGGKTTTMFALAAELVAQGWRVVTTTTTRLFDSQRDESPAWCDAARLDDLGAMLDAHGHVLVSPAFSGETVPGLTVEQVVSVHRREDVDAVLVEADGSRGRLFKAPAPHEPVIPDAATHVVLLIGAAAFGQPLDETRVHRPERVAALAGIEMGSVITPDVVARVVTSSEGGLYHVPDAARLLPFFSSSGSVADGMQAEQAARQMLAHDRVTEVLFGSLHPPAYANKVREPAAEPSNLPTFQPSNIPPFQRFTRGAAVVLAAGLAERFGETKQLLQWRGRTLVEHAAESALELCETVLVIVGHDAEAVANAVDHLPVEVLFNPEYESGQGSSVALGAAALLEASRPFIGEAFFLLADQPRVTAALLRALREARGLQPIALPRHRGHRGAPALFDRDLFPALATLKGDAGGRALFPRYADEIAWVDVEQAAALQDIDTPEAWRRFLARSGG